MTEHNFSIKELESKLNGFVNVSDIYQIAIIQFFSGELAIQFNGGKQIDARMLGDLLGIPDENIVDAHWMMGKGLRVTTGRLAPRQELVTAEIESICAKPKPNFFEMARACIKSKVAWGGETETIWAGNGNGCKVTIHAGGGRDGNGKLYLTFHNGNPYKQEMVQCGTLYPASPFWRFTLTEDEYKKWVSKSKRSAASTKKAAAFFHKSKAIDTGMASGVFNHARHAAAAYDKLNREKAPATVAEMDRLWRADVAQRKLAKAVRAGYGRGKEKLFKS